MLVTGDVRDRRDQRWGLADRAQTVNRRSSATARSKPTYGASGPSMSVSEVARTSVTRALAVPAGSGPAAARRTSPPRAAAAPAGPMARRASTRPATDRNASVTPAWSRSRPPSQAENR